MLITREEMYLAKMAGKIDTVPVPITRREQYLAYLGGMNVDIPAKPITTDEYFLAALCGQEVPEISPVTRVQAYMVGARTRTLPSFIPITREERLWACYINSLEPTIIYKTVSGSIVSFDDAAFGYPLRSLVANIDPVQDLHGYDSPWPAGGGANILDPNIKLSEETIDGVTLTTTNGYQFHISGTASGSSASVFRSNTIIFGNDIVPLPAGTYTLPIGITAQIRNSETGSFLGNMIGTFTTETSFYVSQVWYIVSVGSTVNFDRIIALAKGSTAPAAWTPYSNICPISGRSTVNVWVKPTYDPTENPTATIQLGDTCYGGTLDVTTGVLTVDRASILLNEFSFDGISSAARHVFRAPYRGIIPNVKLPRSDANSWDALCSSYGYKPYAPISASDDGKYAITTSGDRIVFIDHRCSTVEEFMQLNANVQLVYPLATPIEIPLTPTQISALQGQNTLWADSGDVTVEYPAYADDSEGL
jgi:hypothetical protein